MSLKVSKASYSLKAVRDTVYWLSNDFAINLDQDDTHFIVNLEANEESVDFSKVFLRNLNDYALRDLIAKETIDIKNLVTTKAFYPDLIHFNNIGDFEDPVNMDENEAKQI